MLALLEKAHLINEKLSQSVEKKNILDYRIFIELNIEIQVYIIVIDKSIISEDITDITEELSTNYRITFEFFTEEEVQYDPALENIFIENADHKLDLGLKYRFHSLLDNQKNLSNNNSSSCPVVTFYSYKGGMGRTTALCSYALEVALNKNKKVVIVDCDFEAPGYLNFFRLTETNGIVEYLLDMDFKQDGCVNLENYYIRLDNNQFEGLNNIYVFPAGNLSNNDVNGENIEEGMIGTHRDHYLQGLARLDLSNKDRVVNSFKTLFSEINKIIKPDLILIDSRTGFNDIFGTTALVLSNAIVGFFGSSKQTEPGLYFLLDKFYRTIEKDHNSDAVKLILINSILPEKSDINKKFYDGLINKVRMYFDEKQGNIPLEEIYMPIILPLTRNDELESIGLFEDNLLETDDHQNDKYIKLVKEHNFEDYNVIFSTIDSIIFSPKQEQDVIESLESQVLRKNILEELNKVLPSLYAETTEIKPEQFFYRKCMDELFNKEKFIIQGFKGTGKTYLYKALKEELYVDILKKRSGIDEKIKCIDIISEIDNPNDTGNKRFDINYLNFDNIKNEDSYFKLFWVVYTWNSVMLDAPNKLKYNSLIADKVQPIEPNQYTAERFNNLINNPQEIIPIENDLKKLDLFLQENDIKLFVLYDQLDQLVKVSPEKWKKIVSPLVDYWRRALFKNIFAKIFIRTDLILNIEGTNTQILKKRIINIEWSSEEVYSYFFKLIFTNDSSKQKLYELMRRGRVCEDSFINEINFLLDNSENQLPLDRNKIEPFINVFFGNEVMARNSLGKPYDWFFFNLINADNTISLRPFINLIQNAIESSLCRKNEKKREKFYPDPPLIHYPVLHHVDYCDLDNRDRAVEAHFNDLTREAFNADLKVVIDHLKESRNLQYKYIYLTQEEIDQFLKEIATEKQSKLTVFKQDKELLNLLEVNGIIHRTPRPGGAIYYFAQMYKFWLGLKGRKWQNPSNSYTPPKLKKPKERK